MRHHTTLVVNLLVVVLAFAALSHAQNAYFCTQKGYLAYDTRKEFTPDAVGHVLRVVRFEPKRGISLAGDVELPELFTVYHVICTEDRITITGFHNVVAKYVIEVTESSVGLLSSTTDSGQTWSEAAKDGPKPVDLGIFGRVHPLPLESIDPEHQYQLLRNVSSEQTKKGLESHTKSELVQLDLKGTVLQRFVLYEERYVETGD